MKSTIVDADGNVRCPVCGAANSFTAKRTAKAKALGGVAVGVGALAAPKRLRCNGCGTYLKASGGEAKPSLGERLDATADRNRERSARQRERNAEQWAAVRKFLGRD